MDCQTSTAAARAVRPRFSQPRRLRDCSSEEACGPRAVSKDSGVDRGCRHRSPWNSRCLYAVSGGRGFDRGSCSSWIWTSRGGVAVSAGSGFDRGMTGRLFGHPFESLSSLNCNTPLPTPLLVCFWFAILNKKILVESHSSNSFKHSSIAP